MTSCFVYSDLAHKLAGVCGNVFKLLAKNDERSPVRDGVTSGASYRKDERPPLHGV